MNERIEVGQERNQKEISPIEKLPSDIHPSIFEHLSDKELYRLSQTSRQMLFYCEAPLQERKKRAAEKLLSHVVKGEEKEALKMIHSYPKFLLLTSEATDYSKRIYNNYTPFQVALLCHDAALWKKMMPYFDKLKDGQIELAKQFNALFPEGIPQQRPYDFTSLAQTITNSSATDINAALEKTQNNTAICQALNQFRSDFTDLSMREAFFNPSHLIKAFLVYDEQFNNWSWNQRDLFWRQVIGYVQRFEPACYAQAFVQGLCYLVEEKRSLERVFKFKYDTGFYFPLFDSEGLGFDFGICVPMLGTSAWLVQRHPEGYTEVGRVDKLCRANTAELLRLEHRMQHGESITDDDTLTLWSWCAIS